MVRLLQWGAVIGLVLGSAYLALAPDIVNYLVQQSFLLGNWSYPLFVLVLAGAVVFAPVTVVPLIPLASQVFGPFITGLLSVFGWTIGAVGAFLIARYAGRPLVARLGSLTQIDRVAERIPEQQQFWFIVLARHVVPVDLLSYALGFVAAVRFRTYVTATVVGVIWFSFMLAYLGDALFSGKVFLLLQLTFASLAVFILAGYLLYKKY